MSSRSRTLHSLRSTTQLKELTQPALDKLTLENFAQPTLSKLALKDLALPVLD